jgi:hypothetical protein
MPPSDAPNIVMVPVKRYDINLTLHDILTPLTQMSASLAQAVPGPVPGSDIHQHVQQLSDLARQLRDVVDRINAADPRLLAPTPQTQPPNT